jgi:hypothetical protein
MLQWWKPLDGVPADGAVQGQNCPPSPFPISDFTLALQETFMKPIIIAIAALGLSAAAVPASAQKSCEAVKAEIAAKIDAKGVKAYALDAVAKDEVKEGKVVGSCEGGRKKLVYKKS